MLLFLLPIHVFPTLVDYTQIAKGTTIIRHAAVYQHTLDRLLIAVQNAQQITSALAIKLAYGNDVLTHVLDRAELIPSAMSTITVQPVLVWTVT